MKDLEIIQARQSRIEGQLHNLFALQKLPVVNNFFLPWTHFSIEPTALLTILNEIVLGDRASIVECGGGISTIYIAKTLQLLGRGELITIEESSQWSEVLSRQLKNAGLESIVTIVTGPLTPNSKSWDGNSPWYDIESSRQCFEADKIDLLLVDGPSAWKKEENHSRYTALPYFKEFLSPSSVVILDDVNRVGEQDIVKRWTSEFGMNFEFRHGHERIAVGRFTESTYHL
jgi:predicted O-methyltransferase YrrM